MATQVKVPSLGESVTQAVLLKWHKTDGQSVSVDEPICELETDKANVDVPSPGAGVLHRMKQEGETVNVNDVIASIDEVGSAAAKGAPAATPSGAAKPTTQPAPAKPLAAPATPQAVVLEDYSPAVRTLLAEHRLDPKAIPATGPSGRLTKEDVEGFLKSKNGNGAATPTAVAPPTAPPPTALPPVTPPAPTQEAKRDIATKPAKPSAVPMEFDANGIHRAPMSNMRIRIAQNLVNAQHTAAILTTFNEIDMTAVMDLRAKYKERFQEVHGIGLGFMSFFSRATCLALKEFPRVNASIEDNDVVYHNYVHLGIAVSTERGLTVPVLRNVQNMSLARIESEIKRVATATRDGKLGLGELSGGTFTITNGGIFGSLLSTPIINPPQSGILGMHAIQKRPMVVNDKIEIRNMMYVALSYDHRLVDGRESVSFLVRLKQFIEDPARLMLEI